jgi:MFS family permease
MACAASGGVRRGAPAYRGRARPVKAGGAGAVYRAAAAAYTRRVPTATRASAARVLVVLFAAQVCGSTGAAIGMAVGAIMAASITGTNTWSGLPVAVGAVGTALASWPLARLMDRSGRRPGLALGYGLAVVGAGLGMAGVMVRSFPLLLAGMVLFGIAQTSNLLARYAAADVAAGERRGRAMGLIVWGSTVGSIIGPNLMGPAVGVGALLGIGPTPSAFLVSIASYAVAAALVETLLRPDPLLLARGQAAGGAGGCAPAPVRPLRAVLADTRVQVALATLSISQLVMIGTTSTSPLYLHDQGHGVRIIGLAVSLHLGGMYVCSPLSGWLSDRLGRLPTIGLGAAVLIGAVLLAGLVPGRDGGLVILGLFLNGVGWNMAFVAASALLTDALVPAERASIQGGADLVMGLMGALGSTAGGMILGLWGFLALNLAGAALVLAPLAMTLFRSLPAPARVNPRP